MGLKRDDFTQRTKDTLAKRVGFLCSNPNCRNSTVGSNEIGAKSTMVGEAAHITAATKGGPRFDESMSREERKNIENGIWLCGKCATLIDKDPKKFSIDVLREWKTDAEIESAALLRGVPKKATNSEPYLEVDLISRTRSRSHESFSNKNPIKHDKNGNQFYYVSERPIIHWLLAWNFYLKIFNNSNAPALNIKLESIGTTHFTNIDPLPRINNVPPLDHIVLNATYKERVEGDSSVADKILKPRIPERLIDMVLKLTYLDDKRNPYYTVVTVKDDEIVNSKVKK